MARYCQKQQSDIYLLDLETKQLTRLTRHYAIDTEPTWMPDGKSLLFTSDRGGRPQIYRYTLATGKIERVTFEGCITLAPVSLRMGATSRWSISEMDVFTWLFSVDYRAHEYSLKRHSMKAPALHQTDPWLFMRQSAENEVFWVRWRWMGAQFSLSAVKRTGARVVANVV